jgi:hypothetical protein
MRYSIFRSILSATGDYGVWIFVMTTDTGGAPHTPIAQAG